MLWWHIHVLLYLCSHQGPSGSGAWVTHQPVQMQQQTVSPRLLTWPPQQWGVFAVESAVEAAVLARTPSESKYSHRDVWASSCHYSHGADTHRRHILRACSHQQALCDDVDSGICELLYQVWNSSEIILQCVVAESALVWLCGSDASDLMFPYQITEEGHVVEALQELSAEAETAEIGSMVLMEAWRWSSMTEGEW